MHSGRALAALVSACVLPLSLTAQLAPGTVKGIQKISETKGGFTWPLDTNDQLGRSVSTLGDLDGNGVIDLASAGLSDDDGGLDNGAAYIIFLRPGGLGALGVQKISELTGGFVGVLDAGDQFGRALAGIGDLDGDGLPDLAVGANYDDDGGSNRGALWLLRLNADGTVKQTSKISSTQGGFTGPLRANDEFGRAVTALGDLDGDGVIDLAVGAPTDTTGGSRRGAVWILFLNQDGTVKRHVKIASGMGGFTGRLKNLDWWGFSLANLGDFDGDGVTDLAVGAALDDDGGVNAGAAWLLYLKSDGTVKDHRKISMLSGGFTGQLESPDQFGTSVAALGDLNGDGVTELAVGAVKDDDGGTDRGSVYVLFLTADGTVAFHQKIGNLSGNWPLRTLNNWDWLGSALAPLGDLDGDGVFDVAIGARNDDDGGPNNGAFYLTFLNGTPAAVAPVMASGLDPGAGTSESVAFVHADEASDPDEALLADTVSFGHGPEPEGTLELVDGDGTPGSDATFRLRVPETFAGRDAVAHLFSSTRRGQDAAFAERTGILLDLRSLARAGAAVAAPRHAAVEITVRLPREQSPGSLVFQAVWRSGGRRELTDAVEVSLPE
jgi:hypothetical protein